MHGEKLKAAEADGVQKSNRSGRDAGNIRARDNVASWELDFERVAPVGII